MGCLVCGDNLNNLLILVELLDELDLHAPERDRLLCTQEAVLDEVDKLAQTDIV